MLDLIYELYLGNLICILSPNKGMHNLSLFFQPVGGCLVLNIKTTLYTKLRSNDITRN